MKYRRDKIYKNMTIVGFGLLLIFAIGCVEKGSSPPNETVSPTVSGINTVNIPGTIGTSPTPIGVSPTVSIGASHIIPIGGVSTLSKIKHIIIIVQENRAFDHYFGTFPGADGIPMKYGISTVCVPDPQSGICQKPYHNPNDIDKGGPHDASTYIADINGGKMDGFIAQEYEDRKRGCINSTHKGCPSIEEPPDVMGYHDDREIPNYWAYARQFVLQDHMFSSAASWSLPNHLFIMSAWSADCIDTNPMNCDNTLDPKNPTNDTRHAWTDITYLLHKNNISWAFYEDDEQPNPAWFSLVAPVSQFVTVIENNELDNIQNMSKFFDAAETGTLPSVSWIEPSEKNSEHPPRSIKDGQTFVTEIINAIMNSPNWNSSAIFLTWDEFGGFYDHIAPLKIDENGYGFRVPGLVISPYAKKGYIDHQNLSQDAYLKFIEDVFIKGQRIDPNTDNRSDRRPTVRENVSILGDLREDFDFSQPPREPLILKKT